MPSALRRAFVAATLAWTALLVAVPFVATRSHATPFGTALVVAVYSIGALVCHQLPERSYRLWTAQMPVCARCAGIYLGAAFAAVIGVMNAARRRRPLDRSPAVARRILALGATPTALTLLFEWTTGITPSNAVRLAAGIPIGLAVARLVVGVLEDQVN